LKIETWQTALQIQLQIAAGKMWIGSR